MDTAVLVAMITASVTAFGWLVTNVFARKREEEKVRTEASLRYVERQLEELYGPLAAIMYEGRQIFSELLQSLGRKHVFEGNKPLPPEELKAWLFWTETSFLPRNKQIRDLLTSKPHLVDGSEFPKSYINLFLHESSWRIRHERWLKEQITYSWHSTVNWPTEFEKDVLETFKLLKAKHSELLGSLKQ